ncbi:MAG: phosphate ABC transporter substrate-binding protein PstS [Burkholderiaceae bacterium]
MTKFLAGVALAIGTAAAQAADITGAGASFPAPVYAKWAEAYKAATGNNLNYQAIGSGGGIKQITSKTVDFGASDDPMPQADLDKGGLAQFPAVIGGIVAIVNVPGVSPGQMKLTGEVLADIFRGAIKTWNDPKITALNAGLPLPATAITLVYRSDSSGTTAGFTDYLAQVSPAFKDSIGSGKTVNWSTGIGGRGNAGVAANVTKVGGAIGYVEYAYAKQNKVAHVSLRNRDGKFVQPDESSFAAAASNADWNPANGFTVNLNNQKGAEAWPITTTSYILMHKTADKPDRSREALKFFQWSLRNGQKMASELDYVPLPATVVSRIEASWKSIRDQSGTPVLSD